TAVSPRGEETGGGRRSAGQIKTLPSPRGGSSTSRKNFFADFASLASNVPNDWRGIALSATLSGTWGSMKLGQTRSPTAQIYDHAGSCDCLRSVRRRFSHSLGWI